MNRPPWATVFRKMSAAVESLTGLPSVSEVARQDNDPFRVLVATMISLRTKDAVTTAASERLFSVAATPQALASLPEKKIEKLIYPAGFYHTKARNLRRAAETLVQGHHGKVPRTMEELLALPGVGRKTANLVLNLGYGIPGICVDTHVHRISNRTGWVRTKDPAGTERALMEVLPRQYWISVNELLVRFGQTICTPVSPRCSICPNASWCARVNVARSR